MVLWLRALHLTSGGVAEIRGLGEQTGCRNVSFWFNEVEMFRGYRHGISLGRWRFCLLQSVWDDGIFGSWLQKGTL